MSARDTSRYPEVSGASLWQTGLFRVGVAWQFYKWIFRKSFVVLEHKNSSPTLKKEERKFRGWGSEGLDLKYFSESLFCGDFFSNMRISMFSGKRGKRKRQRE